ncbi:MAG TPA: ATP-binding protein [Ktedonobacteraceae bacterium]|nr:ATP-binding protein [Ktedonobacteraceae bacterium]
MPFNPVREGKTVPDHSQHGRQRNRVAGKVEDGAVPPQPILEQLVSRTTDAVIAIDQHFRVRYLNQACSEAIHRLAGEAIGRPCTEVLRCKNLNHVTLCDTENCPLVKALTQGKSLLNEELVIGPEPGHGSEVFTSVTPVEVDGERQVIFIARDTSAVKVASQVRANFVSMVSHELRTPLNSVHGFIDLLLQGHMGELNEEQHTYLGFAQEGVQQLISIVEDILFMTRSDSGQFDMKPQEVNFRVLVRQVVNSMKPLALKAGVVINTDIPTPSPLLFADPQRLKQVLNNLVANAIKFTPPGGTVTIRACQQDERFVKIAVQDNGCGIPLEDRPHIFERFYQSNNRQQSKVGGYGLGLSIARLIVEQHGGEISFETEVDKGTTFFFTMPLYQPPQSD